jgi:hypothetical protein
LATILPVRFLAVASGLIIEKVRSIAMSSLLLSGVSRVAGHRPNSMVRQSRASLLATPRH